MILFVGVIVGCCPMFQRLNDDCLFDDNPHWQVNYYYMGVVIKFNLIGL